MFMAEKGIEIPKQTVDLRKGENREAEHLKRNPHGQMPTLELDNGNYLSEITAICEYLEEKHPDPAADRGDAGRARRMPDVDAPRRSQHLRAYGQRLSLRRRSEVLREADRLRARGSPGLKMIAANRLQWLNGQMADGRDYLCGKRFTLADILLYGWLDFAGHGRPAAGCGQRQHRGVDGACGGAAVGEGVGLSDRHCERSEAIHARRHSGDDGLLRCARNDVDSAVPYITTGASGSSFGPPAAPENASPARATPPRCP